MSLIAGTSPFTADDRSECSCISVRSFRQVPTFGGGTIRRFSNNISDLKKLAARDFEDLLQASGVHVCMFDA
jgi:hypothetical protein